ncbi:MAG: hypothetical protein OEX97_05450 [Acidimicrobiia bacterium]|nr:hypothetical protein [Acidimicrobiia bacterium]
MKARFPILSMIAIALITLIALPAIADDLDSAVTSARGNSLPILSEAEALATASARAQAAAEKPFHADLSPLLGVCDSVGEVVGVGPNVERIFEAFAASGGHWSVITSSNWTSMGSGQTRGADGYLYVSVVFCQGDGVPSPTPTPTTPPTTATTVAATPVPSAPRAASTPTADFLDPFDRELCPLLTGEEPGVDMSDAFCII